MALFVHVTQRCEEEAGRAGWQEDLEKLKNKVERVQDLQDFDHFPAPYRVKKKFPRYNARVIASMHAVGDHDVACFLSILTKADSAYDQFQHNPVEFGQRHFDGLVNAADLHRISVPKKSDAEIVVGQLKLKLSRENKRINMEHQTTSKTSTIRLSPVTCTSDDLAWSSEVSGSKIHKCDEWGLEADFSKLDSTGMIILRFPKSGVEIVLSVG